jgi:hypothetical protein
MRVVVLGRHAAQVTQHEFRGPQSTVDFFHDASRAVEWPSALALALSQVPGAVSPLRPLSAVRDALIANDPALFSWVLAPTRREFSV